MLPCKGPVLLILGVGIQEQIFDLFRTSDDVLFAYHVKSGDFDEGNSLNGFDSGEVSVNNFFAAFQDSGEGHVDAASGDVVLGFDDVVDHAAEGGEGGVED